MTEEAQSDGKDLKGEEQKPPKITLKKWGIDRVGSLTVDLTNRSNYEVALFAKRNEKKERVPAGVVIRRENVYKQSDKTYFGRDGSLEGPLDIDEIKILSEAIDEIDPAKLNLDSNIGSSQEDRIELARQIIAEWNNLIKEGIEASSRE